MDIGHSTPFGLSASIPVVLLVALRFKVFGIGTWQVRLPGVMFISASLALQFLLGIILYKQWLAIVILAVLTLKSSFERFHPLMSRSAKGLYILQRRLLNQNIPRRCISRQGSVD
jgi:hypothetical protein